MRTADAERIVGRLANVCGLAGLCDNILWMIPGKGALAWNHPQNVGAIGVTGTAAANALAEKADVVLCIGTRLQDFTTASGS